MTNNSAVAMHYVSSWRQSGRISLWRYTENERNYPGWHVNADSVGCQSLLALLDALTADGSGSRTISLTRPTKSQLSVPNNKSGMASCVAPERLRITLAATPDEWSFPSQLDPAMLSAGLAWLPSLREGIAGIPNGRGDYSIGVGKEGLPLWFWW